MASELQIRIGADASGVATAVAAARDAVAAAAGRMADDMTRASGRISADMGAALGTVSSQAMAASQGGLEQLRQAGQAVFVQTRTAAERLAIEEARLNGLFRAGAIDAQTLARALSQARAAANADAIAAFNRQVAEGRSVMEGTRTAVERLAAEEQRLNALHRAGAIDAETLRRALLNLQNTAALPPGTGFAAQLLQQFTPTALALAAMAATVVGVKEAIGTMSEFEQLDIQLKAVTGSAEAGKAAFAWIEDFAGRTPFDVKQTAEAFVQLKNVGLDPTDGSLQSIANTAAKYIQGSDGMARAVAQLAQAHSKGRLQFEDMQVLATAGVPVFEALANSQGKSEEQVLKMASAGQLGKPAIKGLIDELGRLSDGAAEDKMQSLAGKISNLGDAVGKTLKVIQEGGALEPLKTGLTEVTTAIDDLRESGALAEFGEDFSRLLVTAQSALGELLGVVGDVLGRVGEIWDGLTGVVEAGTGEQIGLLDILNGALRAVELVLISVRGVAEVSWLLFKAAGVSGLTAVIGFAQDFEERVRQVTVFVASHLEQAGIAFATFGEVAERALQLDFAGAKAALAAGLGEITAEAKRYAAEVADIEADAARRAKENAGVRKEASDAVVEAARRAGEAVKASLQRGIEGQPAVVADPAVKPKPPTKPTSPTTGTGGAGDSAMAGFEAALAAKKLAFEREQNLNGTFFEFSKAEEAKHWEALRDRRDLSRKDQLAIETKFQAAVTAQRREEFKTESDGLKAAASDRRASMATRLAAEAELVALLARVRGTESDEYRAALRQQQALQDEANKEAVADAIDLAKARERLELEALDRAEELLRAEVAAGFKGKAELLEGERAFVAQKLEILRASLAAQLAEMQRYPQLFRSEIKRTEGEQGEVERRQQAEGQRPPPRLNAGDRAQGQEVQLAALMGDGVAAEGALNTMRQIEQGFGTAINGMLMKGQSFRQSMGGLWQGLSATFVSEMVTKPITAFVAGQARLLAIKLATAVKERLIDTTSAATKMTTSGAAAIVGVGNNAITAGTGALASLAGIPIVGPALGLAAMAAVIGAALAMRSSVKSAAGGYDIPRGINPMTQLHEEEMVLPRGPAEMIRQMTASGAGANGSGTTSHAFTFAPTITAWDARSVQELFMENGGVMVRALQEQHRNFATGLGG